ncbi:tryptophan synthase beta subunit-like PLP-dependent enzyme [Daldinia decipiens]|uniref:tryptophan synthase beta subunit-like PLP-dependent enzyme n=1 Tax=Daldinia decipiens TaxID=326647 RepID=UPI0020C32EA2|nr:tryptophan synthase beta subunit-like PLP-dependent enzyme [Daldinia decipiens]KAI1657244.1 tryptophan synthase beta subunit-like PLP-dependent enzyme [Daldinia decipiens]
MADPSTSPPLTRASVAAARELIKPFVHRTPVVTSTSLSALASGADADAGKASPKLRLWFKCENFQKVGAFKARGAFHAIERLKQEPGWLEGGGAEKGVVTHSSGNHAQALALAARANGIPAHIVMPTISAPPKIAATKGYGAHVIFSGSTSVEREAVTAQVVEDTGARLVPPYDHPDIILGQGTLGLEFQEQVEALMMAEEDEKLGPGKKTRRSKKGLDAIIAPCGGGGMLSGVALSCEGTGIRVFGSEPSFQGADDAKRGYESGTRVEAVSSLTVADGLRTPLGRIPWSVIYERRLVSGFYSVSEADIIRALRLAYERLKVVIEPSSAVPLAVALYNEDFREMVEREAGEDGWDVGIVFSGGNVSLEALGKLFAESPEIAK